MGEKNNKPEIRFKGFTEEWEVKKYSETFTKISSNTLSRAELNYNSGLAKNIHYGDVLIKFGELLDVEKEVIPFITNDSLANKFKSSKLQNGDVIIADAAEDETVGKCTELANIGENTIFSGLHTIPSRPMVAFASGYLGYFMNSPAYHTQLLRLMQGTKVLSISKSVLQDTAIIYPIDRFEQSQLGTYYSHLDHLIILHQQKYNKLETIKKSMLEKMFPQNGAKVPEIRFKGFTGDWEERKLGEIGESYTGLSGKTKDDFGHGEGKFVTYMNVFSNPIAQLDLTEPLEVDGKQNEVKNGDVFFTTSSETPEEVGMSSVWLGSSNNTYLNSFCFGYRPVEKINNYYLAYMLRSSSFRKKITFLAQGISRYNISKTKAMEIAVPLPNIKEQEKIGAFFKHLNHLIILQQKDLEKLKNIKKACLEKMFV